MSLRLDRVTQPWRRQVSSWLAPSIIESVQRGTITLAGVATATATISAIDPSRTQLRSLNYLMSADLRSAKARLEITNPTTITATRVHSGAESTIIAFEAIQYVPGIIRSIQRGTTTLTGATTNQAITAVGDTSFTTVDYLGSNDSNPTAGLLTVEAYLQLTSPTNLAIVTTAIGSQVVAWQITEWN